VPVIGYRTDELPAFYTTKSGFPVDYRMDTPEEIAAAIRAQNFLGSPGGMLITNPIPEKYAMPFDVISAAIENALREADRKGIKGKATTPFLLAKITELTGGQSLESNIRLVFNNVELAARIAAAL
jgi:pseudouridine-5'-phosphate glycosidase